MSNKFIRKYFVLKEIDGGFGVGKPPEGYVKLEAQDGRYIVFCDIKNIKYGSGYNYGIYLLQLQGSRRECIKIEEVIAAESTIKNNIVFTEEQLEKEKINIDGINVVVITLEQNKKLFIPLAGLKGIKWDECIRNYILKHKLKNSVVEREKAPFEVKHKNKSTYFKGNKLKVLEDMLKGSFELYMPFRNGRKDYIWFKVNDIAKLSNILYEVKIRIPLFANPKILVGLFKYRHLIAGMYIPHNVKRKGYFILGVPGKYGEDEKPFERACRWVNLDYNSSQGMSGYWLVYIDPITGEFIG